MPDAPLYTRLGEYVLLREVGRGGMGIVYEALQESLHRRAAVKVLPPSPSVDADQVKRFHREAEAAAAITHPNLVTVFGVGRHQGVDFIAMEFLEGEPLDKRLRRAERGLPVEEVVAIGLQVAAGLSCAHAAGILHRDIKPSNLMVVVPDEVPPSAPSGEVSASAATVQLQQVRKDDKTTSTGQRPGLRVKVTDFGLAKPVDDATLTASGTVLGTPMYMSPEQVRGQALDGRADVYSLGIVLYEAATGSPPFVATSSHEMMRKVTDEEPLRPRMLKPSLPRDLETVILKAIEKDRARRYASAADLEEDLRRVRDGEAIHATAVGALGRVTRRVGKHPFVAATVLVALAALVLAGVGLGRGSLAAKERQADARIDEAMRLRGEGRTTDAIAALRDATQLAPKSGRAWRALGEMLLADKQDAAAREAFDRAVALAPRDDAAWSGLARARARSGDWTSAFLAADQAIHLAPDSPDPLRARADLRQLHGEPEKALADLEQAKELEGRAWKRKLGGVDDQLSAKEPLKAIQQLSAFPQSEREQAGWILRRGLALEALAPTANASLLATLQGLDMAVNTQGEEPSAGLRARATEDLMRAIEVGTDDSRAHRALARIAQVQGDAESAHAEWDKTLAMVPDDREALRARARILSDLGKQKEARQDIDRLLALDPEDAEARFLRGEAFLADHALIDRSFGRQSPLAIGLLFNPLLGGIEGIPGSDRAVEDLGAAIRAGVEPRRARLYQAAVFGLVGRTDDALAAIALLQRGAPEDLGLVAARACVLAQAKDFPAARAALDDLIHRAPDSPLSWFTRLNVAQAMKDEAMAQDTLMRMMTAAAKNPDAWKDAFPGEPGVGASHERRFGLTAKDIGDGYRRFEKADLPLFVKALMTDDPKARETAETALWKAGPKAIAPLEEAAGTAGPSSRAAALAKAIRTAVEAEEEGVAADLVKKVPPKNEFGIVVERSPAYQEAMQGGLRLAEAAVRLVRRDRKTNRAGAAEVIRSAAGKDAARLLVPLLGDPDSTLVAAALDSLHVYLSGTGAPPPPEELALLESANADVRAIAVQALAPLLGMKLEETARAGLKSDPAHMREYGTALLTMGSRDGAAELAEEISKQQTPKAASYLLILWLARLPDPRVAEQIRSIALNESHGCRPLAIYALGWLGDEHDLPFLTELLDVKDGGVRAAAALALGRIGSPKPIERLRELMKDDSRSAPGSLQMLLGSPSTAAAWALRALGCTGVEEQIATAASTPALALWVLPELATPELSRAYVKSARGTTGPLQGTALFNLEAVLDAEQVPEALDLLAKATTGGEATILALAIGRTEDPRAVPVLQVRLERSSLPDERMALGWALCRCGSVVKLPEAKELIRRPAWAVYAAEVLARAGDRDALEALRRTMHGERVLGDLFSGPVSALGARFSPGFQATEALALCGDKEAMHVLAACLDSRDLLERRRAGRTLARATGKEIAYEPLSPRAELERARKAWEEALK